MQFAKDSFFVALCDRLSRLNPLRTVCIGGVTRPAVVVAENEAVTAGAASECVFMLGWGTARACEDFNAPAPLIGIDCSIAYGTSGSREDGSDRGRLLTTLDSELLLMCVPPVCQKCDYSQAEAVSLESNIFWTKPTIEIWKQNPAGQDVEDLGKTKTPVFHVAKLTLFFFPEVANEQ